MTLQGTPYITGLMLLANIMLVIWDWDEIKILFNITPVVESKNTWMHDKVWKITGLVLFLFDTTYRFFTDGYNFLFWLGTCFLIGLTGLIFGLKKRKIYANDEQYFLNHSKIQNLQIQNQNKSPIYMLHF